MTIYQVAKKLGANLFNPLYPVPRKTGGIYDLAATDIGEITDKTVTIKQSNNQFYFDLFGFVNTDTQILIMRVTTQPHEGVADAVLQLIDTIW